MIAGATLAEAFATRVAARGVQRVYGFPGGGSNLEIIEALRAVGVAFVLTRTELGAAFMACAEAELTGVPGVVLVGNGPGLTSVVNGVAHAHLDRVPLVVVSDRFTESERRTSGHQILDQRALLEPLVRFSATLEPEGAVETIDAAFAACRRPPRGPVHLDLPRDLASAAPGAASTARVLDEPASATGAGLDAVARALASATRPVVLLGLEAAGDIEPSALEALAARVSAAVLTTYKAKGCFDERQPHWVGLVTGAEAERPVLEQADAILAIGLDPVELMSRSWGYSAPVHSLRSWAGGDEHLRPVTSHVGGLGELVGDLIARLPADVASTWATDELRAAREGWLGRLRLRGAEGLMGWEIVEAVLDEAPPETVLAVDAGAHMFPATCFWRPHGPQRFLISNGLATMGFAVPTAIGAALARPGDLAIAFTGDGGMTYHAAELETAARLGARVIVVVFDDSSLSLIRIKHEANGHAGDPLNFSSVRFETLGKAFGARGWRVDTEPALRDAFRAAASGEGCSVIDARLSGDEYGETLSVIRG